MAGEPPLGGRRPRPIVRSGDHWLWVGGPVPRGAAAITLGPLINVVPGSEGDGRLLAHERVHVEQWRRLGVLGFAWSYVGDYLRWRLRGYPHWGAYRRIGLEVEAEWLSRSTQHR